MGIIIVIAIIWLAALPFFCLAWAAFCGVFIKRRKIKSWRINYADPNPFTRVTMVYEDEEPHGP
jgi:hypothetical protein